MTRKILTIVLALLCLSGCSIQQRVKRADKKFAIGEYYNAADLYKQSFQQYERQLLAEGKPPEDMNAEELYARQKLQINPS